MPLVISFLFRLIFTITGKGPEHLPDVLETAK